MAFILETIFQNNLDDFYLKIGVEPEMKEQEVQAVREMVSQEVQVSRATVSEGMTQTESKELVD